MPLRSKVLLVRLAVCIRSACALDTTSQRRRCRDTCHARVIMHRGRRWCIGLATCEYAHHEDSKGLTTVHAISQTPCRNITHPSLNAVSTCRDNSPTNNLLLMYLCSDTSIMALTITQDDRPRGSMISGNIKGLTMVLTDSVDGF